MPADYIKRARAPATAPPFAFSFVARRAQTHDTLAGAGCDTVSCKALIFHFECAPYFCFTRARELGTQVVVVLRDNRSRLHVGGELREVWRGKIEMRSKNQNLLKRSLLSAMGLALLLPVVASAQQGRYDSRWGAQPQYQSDRDQRDRDRRDQRDRDQRDRDQRDRNDNRQDRRGRNWDRYGSYGGSYQLRQTALNAGYNEGIKQGRNDGRRGRRSNFNDFSAYRNATKDYSSRLGDRELYRRYYREGFENGYEDGIRGY
jgi:hypothetical protein